MSEKKRRSKSSCDSETAERKPIKGWYEVKKTADDEPPELSSKFQRPKRNHSIDASIDDKKKIKYKFMMI